MGFSAIGLAVVGMTTGMLDEAGARSAKRDIWVIEKLRTDVLEFVKTRGKRFDASTASILRGGCDTFGHSRISGLFRLGDLTGGIEGEMAAYGCWVLLPVIMLVLLWRLGMFAILLFFGKQHVFR